MLKKQAALEIAKCAVNRNVILFAFAVSGPVAGFRIVLLIVWPLWQKKALIDTGNFTKC